MKKSFFYSIAAVFALVACSKETEVKVPTGETVTIIASVEQTKSTESHASFSWVAGEEQISVGTSDEEFVTFDVTDAENGVFTHTFTGETPQLLVAVSPVQTGAEFAGADCYEVALPMIYQNYDPSKGITNALMIGTPDLNTPNRFLFRHAAALLKITYANVPVGTNCLILEADKNINSSFNKLTLGGTAVGDIEISNTNSGLNSTQTMICLPEDAPVSQPNTTLTFYVPVPTGEYSMLTVKLGSADGDIESSVKTMDRTNKTPLTLARGDVFNFPTITLDPQPVETYYVKVTSLDEIVDGAQYVIGAWFNDGEGEAFYALPANPTLSSGKITGATVPVSTNGIAIADATGFEWTLSKNDSFWTLSDGSKYLYHSNGGNSGTNLGYGTMASFFWSISEGEGDYGLFEFAGVNGGEVKSRGLLFSGSTSVFGGYALSNYGTASYPGIDLYVLAGEDSRADVTLSFENASYMLSLGTEGYDNFSGQEVTTTPAGVTGVKYALTGAAIGSINEDTGAVTLDGTTVGEATVTASFAGNSTYKPATSVSYTITVDDPNVVDYVTLDWTYPEEDEAATSEGISDIAGVTVSGLGSDYSITNAPYCIKLDGTGDFIQVKTDSAIGEVSVKYKMIGGASTSTLTISESVDGETWTDVEVLTISGSQNDEGILTTRENFADNSRFVKMVFTKGSNVGIGGITINKVDTTPRFTVESPLTAAVAAGDYTVNITRKYFTGAISVSVPTECTWITASNVAENSNTLSLHVATNTGAARSATLTLSGEGVTSQSLDVNQDGNEPGSEANPYTVAQALAAIEALSDGSTETVWVSGTISRVTTYFGNYKSISYYVSDDGTASNELLVYSGKGLDGADFSVITDLAVGDQVTVKGTLTEYNSTPEFNASSQIVSIAYATRYRVNLGSVTNGTIAASATSVGAQGIVTLTATPATGYEFDEWTVTNASTGAAIAVSEEGKFTMPAANVNVSATFKKSVTNSESVDFSQQGYTNSQEITTYTGTNFTVTFDKGTNSNAPKYFTSGTAIRVYGGNSFTVSSSSETITKIEITFGSSDGTNAITTDSDTYSNGTWTGSANSVKFSIDGTSGNRRIAGIKVTF